MVPMPPSEFLESRNSDYYVAGTRISLATMVYEYREGETAEAFFENYPSLGSVDKVHGVIRFIQQNPAAIESYLQEQDDVWEKFCAEHPMPQDMIDRLRRGEQELARRSK